MHDASPSMSRNFACYAWLLANLTGSSALAQAQPKHLAVRKQVPVEPVYKCPAPTEDEASDYLNQVHTYVD